MLNRYTIQRFNNSYPHCSIFNVRFRLPPVPPPQPPTTLVPRLSVSHRRQLNYLITPFGVCQHFMLTNLFQLLVPVSIGSFRQYELFRHIFRRIHTDFFSRCILAVIQHLYAVSFPRITFLCPGSIHIPDFVQFKLWMLL